MKTIKFSTTATPLLPIDLNPGDIIEINNHHVFNAISDESPDENSCTKCSLSVENFRICNLIPCMSRNFHLEKVEK